jgi:hypothetical protein
VAEGDPRGGRSARRRAREAPDAETVVREFCAAGDRRDVEVILTGRMQALDTRGTVSPTEAAPRTRNS